MKVAVSSETLGKQGFRKSLQRMADIALNPEESVLKTEGILCSAQSVQVICYNRLIIRLA